MGAGSAASGSMEEAVGAGAAAWGNTGAEGVAVGAWKPGGGRRGAGPARMGARAKPERRQVTQVQPAVGTGQGHQRLAWVYLQKKELAGARR